MGYEAVPADLRHRPQWIVWRRESRDGRSTKVPYRADGSGRASTTDASSWTTFEHAVEASVRFDGVGFVFTASDTFVGIDLDAGLPDADRGAIMLKLNSYAETSVSGNGAHVIVRASLNGHQRNRRGPLEGFPSFPRA